MKEKKLNWKLLLIVIFLGLLSYFVMGLWKVGLLVSVFGILVLLVYYLKELWVKTGIIGLIYGYVGPSLLFALSIYGGAGSRKIALIFYPSVITKMKLDFLSILYGNTVYIFSQVLFWFSIGAVIGLIYQKWRERR